MFFSKLASLSLLLTSIIGCTAAVPPHHTKCVNPAKRREWRTLSRKQKADWTRAVTCLTKLPHNPNVKSVQGELNFKLNVSSSLYDDMIFLHLDNNDIIHFTGRFLPWHRYYINEYERALKTKCGYKGEAPYWDWTKDADNFLESDFWKESSVEGGLGGFGDPNDDYIVKDGAFGEASEFRLSYPIPHALRRNFTSRPYTTFIIPNILPDPNVEASTTFTKEKIDKMVNSYRGDFKGFQADFEFFSGSHASVHYIVGGDFGGHCVGNSAAEGLCVTGLPYFSGNDPLFWLHHAMVDKVWFDWQNKHPENKVAFFGGSRSDVSSAAVYQKYPNGIEPWLKLSDVLPSNGLFEETTIGRVMDTTAGDLCYVYV